MYIRLPQYVTTIHLVLVVIKIEIYVILLAGEENARQGAEV